MSEHQLLYKTLLYINTIPSNFDMPNITKDSLNIKNPPYTYGEAVSIAIIKIHNENENYIKEMMRDENMFKTSQDHITFIQSGKYMAKSAYNRFNYPHTEDSISEFVDKILNQKN